MATIKTKYPFVGSIETRQGGRDENQDNAGFIDTPLGLLVVVCDGMGGGPGGRTASLMAVDAILSVLAVVSERTPCKNALKYAIEKANDVIYSRAKDEVELQGMGTTVAALLINERSAVMAHVGDSRIYQLRKGSVVFRTSDHSLVANLVRENKLTEEEARNHPNSNVITRALGIRPTVEVEFDEVSFSRGDRFVLCTDGIWGAMSQPELIRRLSRIMGIEELTATTADEIDQMGFQAGGGHDNLTLALLDVSFDSKVSRVSYYSKKGWYKMPLVILAVVGLTALGYGVIRQSDKMLSVPTTVASNNTEKGSVEEPSGKAKQTAQNKQNVPERRVEETFTDVATPTEPEPDFDHASVPAPEATGGPNAPHVFQDKNAANVKKVETAKLVGRIVGNMKELKRKRNSDKRRKHLQEKVIPDVKSLNNHVDDETKPKVEELLKLVDVNRKVKYPRDRHQRAWYNLDPCIDSVIKKIKELEN